MYGPALEVRASVCAGELDRIIEHVSPRPGSTDTALKGLEARDSVPGKRAAAWRAQRVIVAWVLLLGVLLISRDGQHGSQ